MRPEEALEFSEAFGLIGAGWWRQVAWADRQGIPQSLGLTTREWVGKFVGGYVALSLEDRREATLELAAEGLTQRKIADVLGVSRGTVNRELVPNGTAEPSPEHDDEPILSQMGQPEPRQTLGGEADRQARHIDDVAGADAEGEHWKVLVGDFRVRLAELPDESVALILTDPPYPEEFAGLWTDLSWHAKRVLRSGGIVAAMSGKIHLDDRMRRLGEHLAYGWMYAQPLPGSNTRILGRHVAQEWKPWLCYSKGPWPSGRIDWHGDLLAPGPKAKDDHLWQQQLDPAVALVGRLTKPGDLVVDPFCGAGTSGVAAIQVGRRFVGIEKDAGRMMSAAARLRDVKP